MIKSNVKKEQKQFFHGNLPESVEIQSNDLNLIITYNEHKKTSVKFKKAKALKKFVLSVKNLRDTPLFINGMPFGVVSHTNRTLKTF